MICFVIMWKAGFFYIFTSWSTIIKWKGGERNERQVNAKAATHIQCKYSLSQYRYTSVNWKNLIYGRIWESVSIGLNLYSFVWKGFRPQTKSSQIMENHRGGKNHRQPYDEWSYSNPSSPPPSLFSLISADIPCTYTANRSIGHSEIILENNTLFLMSAHFCEDHNL